MGFRIAGAIAAAGFLAQMLWDGRYGYFRDELYYLAASDLLAFGYVDFAPLIAWLTHISRLVFGESLHAFRLLPSLAFGAEVAVPRLLALGLGGMQCAVFVACAA